MIDDGFAAGSVFGDVVLTDRERAVLAEMAAAIDDPWLAGQLVGTVPPPPRRSFQIPTCWVGIVLMMVGAAFALGTFAQSVWAAIMGLAVMVSGGMLLVTPFRTRGERPRVRPVAERGQWAPRTSRKPSG